MMFAKSDFVEEHSLLVSSVLHPHLPSPATLMPHIVKSQRAKKRRGGGIRPDRRRSPSCRNLGSG